MQSEVHVRLAFHIKIPTYTNGLMLYGRTAWVEWGIRTHARSRDVLYEGSYNYNVLLPVQYI